MREALASGQGAVSYAPGSAAAVEVGLLVDEVLALLSEDESEAEHVELDQRGAA